MANQDSISRIIDHMRQLEYERENIIKAGMLALEYLFDVAKKDTGQALTIRLFLLGIYNGQSFPFDLNSLRGLDFDLVNQCLQVLALNALYPSQEIHMYVENGSQVFKNWAESEIKRQSSPQ